MAWKNDGITNQAIARRYAESLCLSRNTNKRADCPICGGKNSFSATNDMGKLKFHCFRNSCGVSGNYINARCSDLDIKNALAIPSIEFENGPWGRGTDDAIFYQLTAVTGNIPTHWKSIEAYDKCWEMLDKYNSLDVYELYPNKFLYDPIQDRLVFVEYETTLNLSLATGRTLCGDAPKWYKYITKAGLFSAATTQEGHTIDVERHRWFICEDALSACSLARFGVALALNGTSYNVKEIRQRVIDRHWPIYICLDEDAKAKAIQLKIDLEAMLGLPVYVLSLSNDAKYLNYHQLKKEINKFHGRSCNVV